ncbi:MAG: DUF1501 domain-containing protein [Planctomycetes bacterium]|nr:DUF1501 domain-containing protein [Planctomycetota bacterium]
MIHRKIAMAHAFGWMRPREPEGLVLPSRRNLLKAGMAGIGGVSLPGLLAAESRGLARSGKAVILLWMAGGPSHIDTWDPKPDRPPENRGPFGTIATSVPGFRFCEHYPKQAALLSKRFTVVRSVDARGSNHEPNVVFQTGNKRAEARTNPETVKYPAIGAIAGKFLGPRLPGAPPYAAFMTGRSHLAFAGRLGPGFDPFLANRAARLPVLTNVGQDTGKVSPGDFFTMRDGLTGERLGQRSSLSKGLDRLRDTLEREGRLDGLDRHERAAIDMLTGPRLRRAMELEAEPMATRDKFGPHLWCQQALLARRLVEAGCRFVTLDLSYHTASGTWDTHGDNIPPYGGISKGLKPLLPLFDHLVTTLVEDLAERGLLDDTLVIAQGEFGRTPMIGTQGSTDGRNHWPEVMSLLMAGGGLRHGQVIGSTEADGGHIANRPVTPADMAATIYRHLGVPLDSVYQDAQGQPFPILPDEGRPIEELF